MVTLASAAAGTEAILPLLVMLTAAKIFAEIFERLRQPSVVGEILAGVLIGPSVLGWVSPSAITHLLSEVGVVFLLFSAGLETKPSSMLRVGRTALLVAVLGIVLPMGAGWGLLRGFGSSHVEALFVGTALVATSVGITARVLSVLGALGSPAGRIILGAAVIDDILGLVVLAIVTGFATGHVDYTGVATTTGLAFGFTAFAAFGAAPLLKRAAPHLENLRVGHSFFIAGLILCLGLAVAATEIGLAAIIGAFLAGMSLAEASEGREEFHQQTSGVTEFLVPFFLVSIGMQLRLGIFRDPATLGLALLLTVVAIFTKLIGCGAGAWSLGWRQAAQVGVGMIPRGEVGIVVAQMGLTLRILSDSRFGVIVFMTIFTTMVTPPLLKLLFTPAVPEFRPD